MSASFYILAWLAAAGPGPAATSDYWTEPRGDYDSRRADFLEHAASAVSGGLYSQIARLELGRGPIDDKAIRTALDSLHARRDGGDFLANGLLRILHYKDSPLVSAGLRAEIKAALLAFKYWVDEPGGRDLLSMWSENHQINYHAAQYLAGQRFPGEIFKNNGKPGRWHQQRGKERILKWIDIKARTGFFEWDSNNCYVSTLAALLNLAELAEDERVRKRAAMITRRDVLRHGGRFLPGHLRDLSRPHLRAGHRLGGPDRGHQWPAAPGLGHGGAREAGQPGAGLPGHRQALPGGAHHRAHRPGPARGADQPRAAEPADRGWRPLRPAFRRPGGLLPAARGGQAHLHRSHRARPARSPTS